MITRRFCASAAPVVKTVTPSTFFSRVRSFASGAVFASAASFYLLFFQLETMTSEIRQGITEVSHRQLVIEQALSAK